MHEKSPQYFKQALISAGLKTSLPRVKVLLALQGGHSEGLTSRQLHEHLVSAGEPLSLLSVRQVIGRLCERNLLVRVGRSRYRLNQAALPDLGPGLAYCADK